MDMGGKDKFETEKGNEDSINYHSLNMSSDWRFGNTNFMNSSSMELISTEIPMAVCKGDLIESSSCSSASMVDSFCPPIWDHHSNSPNMAFSDLITQNNAIATTSSSYPIMGVRKGGLGTLRTGNERAIDMGGWTQPNSMLRGGVYLPVSPGMIPQSLSQFPADSGFIERAARFSCFGGGNFGDVMSPFSFTPMQGSQEGILGSVMKAISGGPSDRNEVIHMVEASKDVSPTELSPLKNESFVRSHDEAKQGLGVSGNESDEAEYSGGDGQEEPSGPEGAGGEPSFSKGLGSKKRKRSGQDTELDQAKRGPQPSDEVTNNNTELEQKGDQNPASAGDKPSGKHGKQQGSQASDAQKDEYIHIRARRGQATNSHSLAERVRREKISERMKFLQDLVPGCSKVTGKAVMLDEIINYVQSLQRQVEFLSMKLATVNPRMDFNVDGLVAKDILSRAGPSSTLGFSHDMTMAFSSLHPSQSGLIQTGLTGMANSSDALRRTINSQLMAMSGGFKDPTPQVPNSWEDELNNVVQMGFNASAPLTSQDLSGSLPAGQMKVEL